MDGVLNINKPPGLTSHDVVQKARAILREKRIGHTGTLDPLATGVLVLCVGKATRIAQYLEAGEKEYEAVMRLGVTTDTLDAEGRVLETRAYTPPDREELVKAMRGLTGVIKQRPPAYSAVKVGGVPSYKLARQGNAEPLNERRVTIYSLDLIEYADPLTRFHVRCSKGVYVRSLCAEMGDILGMGAHLTSLVRTRSGAFRVEDALTLERLADMAETGGLEQALISLDDALADFPAIVVDETDAGKVIHGNRIPCPGSLANTSSAFIKLRNQSGNLLAIARPEAGTLKPEQVFS